MREYKNRYGNVFTFTKDENNDILWEGDFKYCRFGMPNDYTMAYEAYLKDNKGKKHIMTLSQFKDVVHHYDDETLKYEYPEYLKLVASLKNEIDMVDPSGGPYITIGMSLGSLGFKDSVVEDFKMIDTGYKIITKKDGANTQV